MMRYGDENMQTVGTGYPLSACRRESGSSVYRLTVNELMSLTNPGRIPFLMSERGRVMVRFIGPRGNTLDFEWLCNRYAGEQLLEAHYRCGSMTLILDNE